MAFLLDHLWIVPGAFLAILIGMIVREFCWHRRNRDY